MSYGSLSYMFYISIYFFFYDFFFFFLISLFLRFLRPEKPCQKRPEAQTVEYGRTKQSI